MKEILEKLFTNSPLSREEAKSLFRAILASDANQLQVAAVLACYRMRNVSLDELIGFREAALEDCVRLNLTETTAVDVCGTGGDNKNTFNISTISALVIAACGIKVIKHGGGAVSSKVGSSNLLEAAGVKFTNNQDILKTQLDKAGICFLHAPLFHPGFKNAAAVRRELGVKTFFNMLGPVLNPAQPKYQILGVYSLELVKFYRFLSEKLGKNYTIVHTLDGCDEISLTSDAIVSDRNSEKIITASDFGMDKLKYSDIYSGDSIESSLKIFSDILNDNATLQQINAVAANAGLAIHQVNKFENSPVSLSDAAASAVEAIKSGKVKKVFEKLLENAG